jgi:uncharacterized membrane protein YidH (DUF202 family)
MNTIEKYVTSGKETKDDLQTKNNDKLDREEKEIRQKEAVHRTILSWILVVISVLWLIFTGAVIWQYGRGYLQYDSATSVSFILGSLAEVFALWKISLSYFFHVD